MSSASYHYFNFWVSFVGIYLLGSLPLSAQIYNIEQVRDQLQSQNIDEIHIILGGGIGIEQVSEDESFLGIIESRLPNGDSRIPLLILQESDRLISTSKGIQIVQSSLSLAIEALRGPSINPNFRAFKFSNDTPRSRMQALQNSVDLESYGKLFSTENYIVSQQDILEKQLDKYSNIEEVYVGNLFSIDPLNFIFSSGFKKIHFTILGGDEDTLLSIIQIFSHLRMIHADNFEEISVAFYTNAMGAAFSYLNTFGDNIVEKFPHVELLIQNDKGEVFIPLESEEGRLIFERDFSYAKYFDRLFKALLKVDNSNFSPNIFLGEYSFVSDDSHIFNTEEANSMDSLFRKNGIALAFRLLSSSDVEFHYSLSIEDHLLPDNFLELIDANGNIHKLESGYLNQKDGGSVSLEQFVFVLRADQFETLRVHTRLGMVNFSVDEIKSFLHDKHTIGLPGLVSMTREEIFTEQIELDFHLKLSYFVASNDQLSLFKTQLVLDHDDFGLYWMLGSETDLQIAESLLESYKNLRGENCEDVFKMFSDIEVPDARTLSQEIAKYRQWIKLERAKDASRLSNFKRNLNQ